MSLTDLFQGLQSLPLAVSISESSYLFPAIETVHVLALVLVVGSIAVVDLRLLGISSRGHSVHQLSRDVLPVTWIAFAVAVISGVLLFISNAATYGENLFFWLKIGALLLAGANMLVFQFFTSRDMAAWDLAHPAPLAARIAGGLSLLFWIVVVACGRWIGFSI